MKKCPECGNPSYDGAPVCGNCGYTFPKPKVTASKEDSIFQQKPKKGNDSDSQSTLEIIKEKKLLIGAILLITLIVICGIVLTGSGNNKTSPTTPLTSGGMMKYTDGDFAFQYPESWQEINLTDAEHEGAKFFKNDNGTIIEYYHVTSDSESLKEINQQRISYAQDNGAYIDLVETITLDGRNTSNIIQENADGNYTRFVSMFSDGDLYVFKMTGESVNSVTSDDITSMVNTADLA